MREFLAQWRGFRIVGEEFRELDDGSILVVGRQAAEGRLSGLVVEDTMHSVWTFEDGLVTRLLFERDLGAALDAAGA